VVAQSVNSVSIVTSPWAGRLGSYYRQGQCRDIFLFATASRPTLAPTQPPIK